MWTFHACGKLRDPWEHTASKPIHPPPPRLLFYMQHTITWSEGQFIKCIRTSGRKRQPSFLLEPCSRSLGFLIDISVVVTFIFKEKLAKLTERPAYSLGGKSQKLIQTRCVAWSVRSRGWGWISNCITPMRSTPSTSPAVIVSISSPVVRKRPTRRECNHVRCSYRIWGQGSSHPSPFSHTAEDQT